MRAYPDDAAFQRDLHPFVSRLGRAVAVMPTPPGRRRGPDAARPDQPRGPRAAAGMTQTGSWRVGRWPQNTAVGYTTRTGEGTAQGGEGAPLRRNTDLLPGKGSSAGGGYSTAHDLLRLLNALRAHRIPQAPEPGMIGIAGGAPGLNAAMEGDLRGGYDVIVLANLDPPAAERVARLIREALSGDRP